MSASLPPLPALDTPRRWLVTGVAGFIGSHLLHALLRRDQQVVGIDNFSTGHRANLDAVRAAVSPSQWARFELREMDLARPVRLEEALAGVEFVLHQAALGSVPASLEDPLATHASNVTAFLHLLLAARHSRTRRVVYASSSAVFGDATEQPSREDRTGRPLSPYALSKAIDEHYADVCERCYGLSSIGLRYFNVFGPRQDPNGPYAAVIPRWIDALLADRPIEIYGDGETTRDFCHIDNVVHANLLAATRDLPDAAPRVYNVGLGQGTSLNTLFERLRSATGEHHPPALQARAQHRDFRSGDIRHSCADISRIRQWLGFQPVRDIASGLRETVEEFAAQHRARASTRTRSSTSSPTHPTHPPHATAT